MKPELYTTVRITHDDPAQRIHAGDEGALLDWLDAPPNGVPGAIVELHGRPKDPVVTVPASWIEAVEIPKAAAKDPHSGRTKRAG
ncbi:MAG TPA: hypothetical protein VGQ99_02460 [Tepidisphaeraceae bacterium]|nr:hypothetical protein [Tepidisphaeraceae bacterium]